MTPLARKVIDCCREIATHTEQPGRITRTFLSPPMRGVHRLLGAWMERIGMRVEIDAAGNLRGVLGSAERRLLIGSHLDTVPGAGAYDGVLGVVMAIALAETAGDALHNLSIEVAGFSEEEGVRFGIPFIGSRALCGTLDDKILDCGVREAIHAYGLDTANLPAARMTPGTIGYLEFHIEQGPVLENLGFPLGIVDAIAGQSRLNLTFTGHANHAGTTPMHLRRDALAAAAEWITHVEIVALRTPGVVATTGSIHADPNASNVIAGTAHVSLDARSASDATRTAAVAELLAEATEICGKRSLALTHETTLDQPAVAMDPAFCDALAQAAREAGHNARRMVSGAGHDAMILAAHVPSAMLFVRSPGGVSHHSDESVVPEDIDAALETALRFLQYV